MARDAALLERGQYCARVYTWDGPWVSLGMFQSPERDLLPNCPVPSVLRPTGGRAVLHGHDVTVGLAIPLAHIDPNADLTRAVRRVYRALATPLIKSLRVCGIPAVLGEETPFHGRSPRSTDCFAHVAANDIVDERTGVKVCGCALRITETAALVQASIPAGPPLVDPSLVYSNPAQPNFVTLRPEDFAEALSAIGCPF